MNPNDSITAEIRNTPQAQHLLECLVAANTLPNKPIKQYIGTKIVWAFPESKGPLPGGEEGYAVIYKDGYRSWSPKAVFEAAYKERHAVDGLQPHQQRVVDEKADLDEKRLKLQDFTAKPVFLGLPISERDRLFRQAALMRDYSEVLAERIAEF